MSAITYERLVVQAAVLAQQTPRQRSLARSGWINHRAGPRAALRVASEGEQGGMFRLGLAGHRPQLGKEVAQHRWFGLAWKQGGDGRCRSQSAQPSHAAPGG